MGNSDKMLTLDTMYLLGTAPMEIARGYGLAHARVLGADRFRFEGIAYEDRKTVLGDRCNEIASQLQRAQVDLWHRVYSCVAGLTASYLGFPGRKVNFGRPDYKGQFNSTDNDNTEGIYYIFYAEEKDGDFLQFLQEPSDNYVDRLHFEEEGAHFKAILQLNRAGARIPRIKANRAYGEPVFTQAIIMQLKLVGDVGAYAEMDRDSYGEDSSETDEDIIKRCYRGGKIQIGTFFPIFFQLKRELTDWDYSEYFKGVLTVD